ncbi:MAG: hypothetical protein HQK51_08840 [Oligoflexia bacterium]|nr:hypothetical protein [Oligoflexia bacterium]
MFSSRINLPASSASSIAETKSVAAPVRAASSRKKTYNADVENTDTDTDVENDDSNIACIPFNVRTPFTGFSYQTDTFIKKYLDFYKKEYNRTLRPSYYNTILSSADKVYSNLNNTIVIDNPKYQPDDDVFLPLDCNSDVQEYLLTIGFPANSIIDIKFKKNDSWFDSKIKAVIYQKAHTSEENVKVIKVPSSKCTIDKIIVSNFKANQFKAKLLDKKPKEKLFYRPQLDGKYLNSDSNLKEFCLE